MSYVHIHVSEVPDNPVVECTTASVLEVARAVLNGHPNQPPATSAERERLRAVSGASDLHGANIGQLVRGARARYGIELVQGPLPDLALMPDGTFLAVQGDYHALPAHYQRFDPHFASHAGAGHCVCVFKTGGTLTWCDPLAPWGPYDGEPVSASIVEAYFGALPGAQVAAGMLGTAPRVQHFDLSTTRKQHVYHWPGGPVADDRHMGPGPVYDALRRHAGGWWYKIVGPARSDLVGYWVPAEPWIDAEVQK